MPTFALRVEDHGLVVDRLEELAALFGAQTGTDTRAKEASSGEHESAVSRNDLARNTKKRNNGEPTTSHQPATVQTAEWLITHRSAKTRPENVIDQPTDLVGAVLQQHVVGGGHHVCRRKLLETCVAATESGRQTNIRTTRAEHRRRVMHAKSTAAAGNDELTHRYRMYCRKRLYCARNCNSTNNTRSAPRGGK
jgi:hypothetical protein